ncbi:WD40 repeat domain-containing protein [Streptomyces sp. NPDC087903]|uniref:WD40 repeat domain-containing protein n=1 Tax=Streptomyces sp. NPDC087903 TaxID=3365819 RepID=UPI00382F1706
MRTLSLHGLTDRAWRGRAAAEPARRVTGHGTEVVAVDPTGRTAVTAEDELLDMATDRRIKGVAGVTGEDLLTAGAFAADGDRLAVADHLGRLTLWNARTWHRIAVLRATGSTLHKVALAFSADGSLLAAGPADGSVQVWETDSPTLAPATLPAGDDPVLALGFSARDGALHITTPHLADRTVASAPVRAAAEVCARAEGGLTEAEWRLHFPSTSYRRTCGP